MEAGSLRSFIEAKLPGTVLEAQKFGRAGATALWIEGASIADVSRLLRDAPETGFDWLESLSCMQIDSTLVLTYFVGRSSDPESRPLRLLRASLAVDDPRAVPRIPSVRAVWAAAAPYEDELAELFGVDFLPRDGGFRILPPEIKGFPMRKGGSVAAG